MRLGLGEDGGGEGEPGDLVAQVADFLALSGDGLAERGDGLAESFSRQQHPSHEQFADGYLLTRADVAFYWDNYLPADSDRSDPRAAPAATGDFTGLPPTVIATAGFDPLRDEGREYARRLIEANVPTVYLPFPRLTHGFLDMAGRVRQRGRQPPSLRSP